MKTAIQELIEEFEIIKTTKCKTLQEMIFFDGILAIIESKYLEKEKEQIIEGHFAGWSDAYDYLREDNNDRARQAEEYYEETYNQNK